MAPHWHCALLRSSVDSAQKLNSWSSPYSTSKWQAGTAKKRCRRPKSSSSTSLFDTDDAETGSNRRMQTRIRNEMKWNERPFSILQINYNSFCLSHQALMHYPGSVWWKKRVWMGVSCEVMTLEKHLMKRLSQWSRIHRCCSASIRSHHRAHRRTQWTIRLQSVNLLQIVVKNIRKKSS